MTAILFVLSDLATGRRLGNALICADARYASIRWTGGDRLERRHGTPTAWRAVTSTLALGLPPGPLHRASPVVELLGVRSDVVVQYLSQEPLEAAPAATTAALDARLSVPDA